MYISKTNCVNKACRDTDVLTVWIGICNRKMKWPLIGCIALITITAVDLSLGDTLGCSLPHPIVRPDHEFVLRVMPFTECEPSRHFQVLATVRSLDMHSQFFKQARCGVPFDWAVPASTFPGTFTVTVKVLFYNFTDKQILHDLNHHRKEDEWARLVNEWGVQYANATLCQAELLVSANELGASAATVAATAKLVTPLSETAELAGLQRLDNIMGYWNLTSATFTARGGGLAAPDINPPIAMPGGEYMMFGDSVLRGLFAHVCSLAGAIAVPVADANDTSDNCQRCCSPDGPGMVCLQRQMWWHGGFGDTIPPSSTCPSPANVQALYLSFGSHAHGIGSTNEQLERSERLMLNAKASFNASGLLVAAITAINEDVIPLQYQKQTFLLSNGRIHHRNLLAQVACQRAPPCHFLDLYNPTLALRDAPGGFRFGDPIHFGVGREAIAQLVVQGLATSARTTTAQ